MKIFTPLFILFLLISACSGKYQPIEETNEFGHVITYVIEKESKVKDGKYTVKTKDGKWVEEAFYKNGKLNGERKIYDKNGKLSSVENYRDDTFDGPYKNYFPNGEIKFEGEYKNGELSGDTKSYYESGQLKELVHFEGNLENGRFIEYYENGNLKAEGKYLNGDNEDGELKIYNEQGKLIKKMDCVKGVCRTTWTDAEEEANQDSKI